MDPVTITITSAGDPSKPLTESQVQRITERLARMEETWLVTASAAATPGGLTVTMVFEAELRAAWHLANQIYVYAVLGSGYT